MFGLIERDIEYIVKAMKKFNEIEKAIVFGSRAIGNYKKGSDVDIAIIGDGIDSKTVYKLDDYLNEVYICNYMKKRKLRFITYKVIFSTFRT